jgi:hypothetical protein
VVLFAIAYVLGGVREIVWPKNLMRSFVFGMVFGVAGLREAIKTVQQVLERDAADDAASAWRVSVERAVPGYRLRHCLDPAVHVVEAPGQRPD